MDPCLRMGGVPVKSLWVRRQTSMGDVVMVICYRLLQQEKQADKPFLQHEEVHIHMVFFFMGHF